MQVWHVKAEVVLKTSIHISGSRMFFGGTAIFNRLPNPNARQAGSRTGATASLLLVKLQTIKTNYSNGAYVRFPFDPEQRHSKGLLFDARLQRAACSMRRLTVNRAELRISCWAARTDLDTTRPSTEKKLLRLTQVLGSPRGRKTDR